jgi:hypothetical protein
MEKIIDVVDAVKFLPGRPGRILIRLLVHKEPLIILYTVDDPLKYGETNITIDSIQVKCHYKIVETLLKTPVGKTLCIEFIPREDLARAGTEAHFTFCDTAQWQK